MPSTNSGASIFNKTSNNFWDKKEDKSKSKAMGSNDFWGSDAEDDEEIDYDNTNLNKLSNEELKKHKDKMNVLFSKNQAKPGDSNFIYDKQEEFHPQESNEWDEDF